MINVYADGEHCSVKFFGFPGGERNVQITGLAYNYKIQEYKDICIIADIESSDDVMDLFMLTDALDRHSNSSVRLGNRHLIMPYLPYARQDRVMQTGEANGVARFAQLINMMGFNNVLVVDPHSDVGPSHIKNLCPVSQAEIIGLTLSDFDYEDVVLCSPDAGALKKIYQFAERVEYYGDIAVGQKHRDLRTGEITGTSFHGADVNGKTVLIVDDICDGGATFVHLGKALKSAGASKVVLAVTHGIFSKGIDGVFEGAVDEIYTPLPWTKNIEGKNEKGILKTVDKYNFHQ